MKLYCLIRKKSIPSRDQYKTELQTLVIAREIIDKDLSGFGTFKRSNSHGKSQLKSYK